MLPHLTFPVVPLFSVQLRVPHWIHSAMEWMVWIAGIAGLWERGQGWGQAETKGSSTNREAPASRSNGKRGMSLQVSGSCSLAGDDVVKYWNGAVQFPELCSLCCCAPALPAACTVRHLQPASSTLHSQRISQTTPFISSPPRGTRGLQTSLVGGVLAAWEHLVRGIYVGQGGIFYISSPLRCNGEKKNGLWRFGGR